MNSEPNQSPANDIGYLFIFFRRECEVEPGERERENADTDEEWRRKVEEEITGVEDLEWRWNKVGILNTAHTDLALLNRRDTWQHGVRDTVRRDDSEDK